MKQTNFSFTLQLDAADPQATLSELKAKLLATPGINAVTANDTGVLELTLNVSFADAPQAKKLHRQVMKLLIAQAGIRISSVSSTLTDIY